MTRQSRTQIIWLGLASLGLALASVGCGNTKADKTNTPTPRTQPTPQPTAISPTAGLIQFGVVKGTFKALSSNIPKGKGFAWLATFNKMPGTSHITLQIKVISGEGANTIIVNQPVTTAAKAESIQGSFTAAQVKQEGLSPKTTNMTYQMTYTAGSTVLASSDFEILNCTQCGGGGGGY